MDLENQSLQDLRHIKQMMERSSRFISLSGLSGVAAGICALIGAGFAWFTLFQYDMQNNILFHSNRGRYISRDGLTLLAKDILLIAALTFIAALVSSFVFTYFRSKRTGIPLWGATTFRLLWNTFVPLVAGGIFLLKCLTIQSYSLITPGCLIFYGLALINASKYTLGEVRYLGYGQVILGLLNLWLTGYGLYLWAIGFGLLHIIYGLLMWYKYERNTVVSQPANLA